MCIQCDDPINEKELYNLRKQLPKPFILMKEFNCDIILWRNKETNKRGHTLKIATIYASSITNLRLTLTNPRVYSQPEA